jgi:hypothetical protein
MKGRSEGAAGINWPEVLIKDLNAHLESLWGVEISYTLAAAKKGGTTV